MLAVVSLLILMPFQSSAQQAGWLEAIAAGNDLKAAQILENYSHELSGRFDATFQTLIEETVVHLRNGFDCPEKDKITLYRRMTPGKTDAAIPKGGKNIVFPARAFMTANRQFKSSGLTQTLAQRSFESMRSTHSGPLGFNSYYNNSYLISTAMGGGIRFDNVPTDAPTSAVLRVCPQRLVTGRFSESDVLLPFFIHPNEVVAITSVTGSDSEDTFDFKVIYSGIGQNAADTKKVVLKLGRNSENVPKKCEKALLRFDPT